MADERRDEGNGKDPGSRRGQIGREGSEGGPAGGPTGGDGRSDEGRRRSAGRHRGFHGRQGQAWRQGAAGAGAAGASAGQEEAQQRREGPGRGFEREPGWKQGPEEKRELSTCPLCGKALYDLSTALAANKDTGEPAHFDCVLERVIAAETLAGDERIVYLGSGAFGVVDCTDKGETAFTVKRRIQWEKEGEKKDWRRSLSSRISNL